MKKILLIGLLCLPMFSGFADAAEETKPTALSEAEQLLIDSIKGVRTGVSNTIDFAKEQIPDVVQQLVVYNFAYHSFMLAIGVILFIIALICSLKVFPHIRKAQDAGFAAFGIFMVNIPIAMAWIPLILSNIDDVLKLWLAPKVWLLEYAASLLKGN